MYYTFSGCKEEFDNVWGILWPATNAGEFAVQKCPGGIESLGKAELYCIYVLLYIYTLWIGFARRSCDSNKMWNDNSLDVSECQSVEVTNILEDIEALNGSTNLSKLTEIADRISNVVNSSGPILPRDLQSTTEILSNIIRYRFLTKIILFIFYIHV